MPFFPVKVKLAAGENTMAIHWSDGHESVYPYRYLRSRCPCASCDEMGPPPEEAAGGLPILGQRPLHPERAELVGRYALQVYWSDGHSAGIYAFDHLRRLCPCAECTAHREAAESND